MSQREGRLVKKANLQQEKNLIFWFLRFLFRIFVEKNIFFAQ